MALKVKLVSESEARIENVMSNWLHSNLEGSFLFMLLEKIFYF